MGIQGLLPILDGVAHRRHLSDYSGKRAAIDANGWLHAGACGCALELATGVDTRKHIEYCLKKLALLRRFKVEPVLIFDGEPTKAKQLTNDSRRHSRRKKFCEGEAKLREGDVTKARVCFSQAITVGHEMVTKLTSELVRSGTKFIVAPNEADIQLAYLAQSGHVDFCIAEDSDLLAVGCPMVLFKLDWDGLGKEIRLEDALAGRPFDEFLTACVLMGCDYLKRLRGLGPKKALRLVESCGPDIEQIAREARRKYALNVPRTYVKDFLSAREAFFAQDVIDPASGEVLAFDRFARAPRRTAAPAIEDAPAEYRARSRSYRRASRRERSHSLKRNGHRNRCEFSPSRPRGSPRYRSSKRRCRSQFHGESCSGSRSQSRSDRSGASSVYNPRRSSRSSSRRHRSSGPQEIRQRADARWRSTSDRDPQMRRMLPDQTAFADIENWSGQGNSESMERQIPRRCNSSRSPSRGESEDSVNIRGHRRKKVKKLAITDKQSNAIALYDEKHAARMADLDDNRLPNVSAFIADTYVPAQMTRRPQMSLADFLQREREESKPQCARKCPRRIKPAK